MVIEIVSKKQQKKDRERLIKFCKENHVLMWNVMNNIEGYADDKVEKLKKEIEMKK